MVELSIQLLQSLAVLIPVMFASIRFVHNQQDPDSFETSKTILTRTDNDGMTHEVSMPYSSLLLGLTFAPLMISLILLVANIGISSRYGQPSSGVLQIAVLLMIIGLALLLVFIIRSLPRYRLSYF